MARDVQRPDIIDVTTTRPAEPGDPELFHPEDRDQPRARPGAYWTGLVVLAVGLAVTIATLATRVTSIVQTILLAIPLALIGIGLERVGRGTGRGSLRAVGALLLVVAVVGPLVLSLSSPGAVAMLSVSPAAASRRKSGLSASTASALSSTSAPPRSTGPAGRTRSTATCSPTWPACCQRAAGSTSRRWRSGAR